MNKLVSGAIGVSIKVTGDKIYLPDILDLKDKRIKHIDLCDSLTYDSDGNVIATNVSGTLDLIEKNTKELKTRGLSLSMLSLSNNKGNRFFVNKIIDMPVSYISLSNSTPNLNKYIFLLFWFDEPKVMRNVIETGKTTIDNFEVVIPNLTNNRYMFGENRNLFNKMFQNIMFCGTTGIKTPGGNTSVADSLSLCSFITLQKDNYAYMRDVPVYVFDQRATTYGLRLQNVMFDFTNSFIKVGDKTNLVANQSFFFNCINDDNE